MKTFKKLAFVLAVLLALGCVAPMAAMAEGTDTIGYSKENVEKIDTTGYTDINDAATLVAKGKYTINDEAGLMKLAKLVNEAGTGNTFYAEGATFVQTRDLDLEGYAWTPIGSCVNTSGTNVDKYPSTGICTAFWSTYDGQGYTISNMKYEVTTEIDKFTAVGLFFNYGRRSTVIKNVVLDETCELKYTARTVKSVPMGSIIAIIDASSWEISNCYSAATIKNADTSGDSGTGGIVGCIKGSTASNAKALVSNCTFAGSAEGVRRTGGIVGYVQNVYATISNCCNIGSVKTTGGSSADDNSNAVAGICAAPNNNNASLTTISNCANYGTITASLENLLAGGIVGVVRAQNNLSGNIDYGTVVIPKGTEPTTVYGAIFAGENANGVDNTNKVLRDADKAMFHGYQIRANGENAVDLRLVASIDSKSYSAVGMKVTVTFTHNGNPVTKVLDTEAGSKTTTVYNSLTAYANDESVNYTAEALRVDEKEGFLYAVVLTGIPKAAFTSGNFTVTVTPYAVDLENAETEYTGVQAVKVITLENLPDNTVPAN